MTHSFGLFSSRSYLHRGHSPQESCMPYYVANKLICMWILSWSLKHRSSCTVHVRLIISPSVIYMCNWFWSSRSASDSSVHTMPVINVFSSVIVTVTLIIQHSMTGLRVMNCWGHGRCNHRLILCIISAFAWNELAPPKQKPQVFPVWQKATWLS
jgi:hypothetical protein